MITKQPYEEYMIGADFTSDLNVNDETIVLANSTVLAWDKEGEDVIADILNGGKSLTTNPDRADGNPRANATLQIKVIAGDSLLSPYNLSYRIITNTGQKFEKDIKLKIKEKTK